MPAQALLFDLDGTLLDTLADIADSANAALERAGRPTHPVDRYRQFVGDGVVTLFERCLPPGEGADADLVARCVAHFQETYAEGWKRRSHPYDGIPALLDALAARGLPLAILSNKPDDFTQLCTQHFLGAWTWAAVAGQRAGIPRKPDPAGALAIADALGIAPGDWLYVGDSGVDMRTATGAGMVPVGISWGFRAVDELWATGARAVIDRPGQLLGLLDSAPPQRA